MSNESFTEIMEGIETALEGISAMAGPTGPTGPAGATGPTGPTGASGTSIPVQGKIALNGTLYPGSVGISSVTHNGTGSYTVHFSNFFSDLNYKPFLTGDATSGQNLHYDISSTDHVDISAFADSEFTILILA